MTTGWLALFTVPMELGGVGRLALMVPLCLFVAVVYKAIRSERVEEIPTAALRLWLTILGGMCGVGLSLWALFELMV